MQTNTKVPVWLQRHLVALLTTVGVAGGGAVYVADAQVKEAQRDEYVQAVSADADTSLSVKIAMVMGRYYESSGKHIGDPYIDKNGRGQPLTVCNGITGRDVVAGRWYSPADCYRLEKGRYLALERNAPALLTHWRTYDPFVQATFLDFGYNKGEQELRTSTMRRLANAGDIVGACRQNPRWNKGTVNGVLSWRPGLQIRGDSNADLCEFWRIDQPLHSGPKK